MAKKYLIYGHSQAKRLDLYTKTSRKYNFEIPISEAEVECVGISGLHAKDVLKGGKHYRTFDAKLRSFKPQILILCIGDNDISEETLSDEISSLVEVIITKIKKKYTFLEKILVSSILPRYENSHVNHLSYNEQAFQVNQKLCAWAIKQKYSFFIWNPLPFPNQNMKKYQNFRRSNFLRDGVHLSPAGYFKMFRAIRRLIKKFIPKKVKC